MSKHAIELSVLLVGEVYGELFSVLYESLLRFGRLSLGTLTRKVALPASVVKAGLAVLIQQGLVLHHTVKKGEGTSYEANWLAAYCLLRSGKILHLATEQLGINAGIVMDELLAQGHVRIKDLRNLFLQRLGAQESISVDEQSIEINSSSSRPSQPSNGAGEEDEISKIHYLENGERILDSTLQSLYLEGYLDRIGITDFIPSTDLLEEAEAEVARMDYPKTSKSATQEKIEAQILVESQVRTWKIQKSETLGLQRRGIKRDREEDEQVVRSKKLKTKTEPKAEESTVWQSKYTDSALAENDRVFKADLVVGVDHSRCMIPYRDMVLAHAAEVRIGRAASLVYKFLLQQLSYHSNQKRMNFSNLAGNLFGGDDNFGDKQHIPPVTTEELIDGIQEDDLLAFDRLTANHKPNPSDGISEESTKPNGFHGLGDVTQQDGHDMIDLQKSNDAQHITAGGIEADDYKLKRQSHGPSLPKDYWSRFEAFESNLEVLAEDSYHFVRCTKVGRVSSWTVDHKKIASKLRQHELENIVCQRFGDMALRIFRFLHRKGKMDEKKIQASTLIKMKQVRATLSILHTAGFLEIQEVPRENARQVSRNIYLWFSDYDRCRQVVLENTYQTISRCLQRASHERGQLRTLLEKAERSDVKENPDELLTGMEKAMLSHLKAKEERLLVQVGRLDELVAIFRDY